MSAPTVPNITVAPQSQEALQVLQQQDRASVLHPSTNIADFAAGTVPSTIVESALGVRIRDAEGRKLIDAFAGLYCVNIGYGRTEVAEAIARQAHQLAYYHTYAGHSTTELIRLSDRLSRWRLLPTAPACGASSMAPPGQTRMRHRPSSSGTTTT